MVARDVLDALIGQMTTPEEKDCCGLMAELLQKHGWHVAENDSELKELAVSELGMVDPEG